MVEAAIQMYKSTFQVDCVLLLIDEASWLLEETNKSVEKISAFRLVRRALRLQGITGLFAATNAAVQNFMPAEHLKQADSLKEELENEDAFEGIPITQAMCNVGPLDLRLIVPWKDGLSLDDVFNVRRLATYGRPLWHGVITHAKPMSNQESLEHLIRYAGRKPQMTLEPSGHLAAVLCVTNLMGLNPGRLVDSVVQSHMATLRSISEDRSILYATYVSEPYLHMSAIERLAANQNLLKTCFNNLGQGLIGIGYVGEMVARLALAISRAPAIASVTTLQDYVKAVCGISLRSGRSDYMSLTHWVTWDAEVSQECLFDAFLRTAGLITTRNEQAVDLIILAARIGRQRKVTVENMTAI